MPCEFFAYRSDPEVGRYQSWAPESLADAQRFIANLQPVAFDTPGTWFQFGIRLQNPRLLIGDLGVHFPADAPDQAEIGFTLAPAHQGQGLATEAVGAVLDYLFVSVRNIIEFLLRSIRIIYRSIRLLSGLGCARRRTSGKVCGSRASWADDVVFADIGFGMEGIASKQRGTAPRGREQQAWGVHGEKSHLFARFAARWCRPARWPAPNAGRMKPPAGRVIFTELRSENPAEKTPKKNNPWTRYVYILIVGLIILGFHTILTSADLLLLVLHRRDCCYSQWFDCIIVRRRGIPAIPAKPIIPSCYPKREGIRNWSGG